MKYTYSILKGYLLGNFNFSLYTPQISMIENWIETKLNMKFLRNHWIIIPLMFEFHCKI